MSEEVPEGHVVLDEPCPTCNETGRNGGRLCDDCKGVGCRITEKGRPFLEQFRQPQHLDLLLGLNREHVFEATAKQKSIAAKIPKDGRDFVRDHIRAERLWWRERILECEASPHWVYKNNTPPEEHQRSWGDWERFFQEEWPLWWGGTWMTGDSTSLNIIQEDLQPDALFLAYQTNRRCIIGITRLTVVRPVVHRSGRLKSTELAFEPTLHFEQPVPIHDLKSAHPWLQEVKAFQQGPMGTLHGLSRLEGQRIAKLCLAQQET